MRLQLEDFTKYTFLSNPTSSPTGQEVAFVVHTPDLEENTYRSHLWIYRRDTDEYFQLTTAGNESAYIWLDCGDLLFSDVRNPKDRERLDAGEEFTVFYRISLRGGEAQEAFRIPHRVKEIKEVSPTEFLFTAAYNPRVRSLVGLSKQEQDEELKRRKEEKDYEVLEEIPFWSNGQGFISGNRTRLYRFSTGTGAVKALTDSQLDIGHWELDADRKQVVIIGTRYTGKRPVTNGLYLMSLEKDSLRPLGPEDHFRYRYAGFLNAETIICVGSDMAHYGLNENAKFYRIELGTGQHTCLTPDFTASTANSVGSDCRYGSSPSMKIRDGYLYFITTEEDSSFVNRIDGSGQIQQITTQPGSVDGYDLARDSLVFLGMRGLKLQELYRLDGDQEKQITTFNEWVQQKALSHPERIAVTTAPGVEITGWVMRPVDFDPEQQYPGILNIHGGPKTVYGEVFFHEMQYWANAGYFVFFCNPRGSDGRGNDFADIRGKYGTIDYEDLMAFTDAVLEKYPNIDKNRVGVTGGSYGGFMTNWIIGQTDRFAAAASQRSISNWISKFCTTDIGYYFNQDQIAANPWDNPDKLWWHSPLKYAHRVKTPTLFIHSEEDYRCWVVEGLQMFTALKYHGVEARLCMFRGENHELSRSGKPKHRIRRLQEITNWFDKYLK